MTTDFRALCEELTRELAQGWPRTFDVPDVLGRARAALAQSELEVADGPAVLEGREPAAVVGEPSDEELKAAYWEAYWEAAMCGAEASWLAGLRAVANLSRPALAQPEPEVVGPSDDSGDEWQWYTYCPEEGIELYSSRQQAQSAAQSIMGSYAVAAHSDGWHEDIELVSWGMLVPVEQAQVVERGPADPGGDFGEWVRYELRPSARWGGPAPAPAEPEISAEEAAIIAAPWSYLNPPQAGAGEVAELVAALRNEAIDCACTTLTSGDLRRAADLLERQAAPVPVAVADRLPQPEDCDEQSRCWWLTMDWEVPALWEQSSTVTHWLPAHVLQLPVATPAGQEGA